MKIIEHLFLHEESWNAPKIYRNLNSAGFSFEQTKNISNIIKLSRSIEIDSNFNVGSVRFSSHTKVHGLCVMYLDWKEITTLKKLNEIEVQMNKTLGTSLADYFPTEYILLFKAGLK